MWVALHGYSQNSFLKTNKEKLSPQDSTQKNKYHLLGIEISTSTTQMSSKPLIGFNFNAHYEHLLRLKKSNFYLALGGGCNYNNSKAYIYYRNPITSSEYVTDVNFKTLGLQAIAGINYTSPLTNKTGFLAMTSLNYGFNRIFYHRQTSYENNILLSEATFNWPDRTGKYLLSILSVNIDMGVFRKINSLNYLFLTAGIKINKDPFRKIGIVTSSVEPLINFGLIF